MSALANALSNRLIPNVFQRSLQSFGQQAPRLLNAGPAGRQVVNQAGTTAQHASQLLQRAGQAAPRQGLNPGQVFLEATGLGYAIPRAAEAGIGLFEAAEGVVRGQNPRQIMNRMNQPGYQGIVNPASPQGSLRNFGPGYKEKEQQAGRQAEQFRAGAGFPGQQRTGGPQPPGAGLGNLAATQPGSAPATVTTYDMTPQGQFQRYFTDNQMGQYFGGAPSAQAPKSAEAMQEAAMLQKAPTTMPLADYYRAQSATGRANMDQIVSAMGYTGDMEKWARANPMLAQRAYAGQFQGGVPTQGAPGAQPVVDEALNPSSPEFRGVGGSGERIYNFAADDVDAAKIKAFQELINNQRQ